MKPALLECVPNISEGRDLARVDAVADAVTGVAGVRLLHRTSDTDHNRSVLTFAGSPASVSEAAVRAVAIAAALIDLTTHQGVHPRVGALDVLPFVPLSGMTMEECIAIAHEAGERIWRELGIPVYFYEAAARMPSRRKLEDVRRGQFEGLSEGVLIDQAKRPDIGGPRLHPTAGAVIVGARKILIAYNINLQSPDLRVAQSIAARIRERGGGFSGVKALGLALESRGLVQVSMNITDHEASPVHAVFDEVQRLAAEQGVQVEESELIGLMPRSAIEAAARNALKMKNFATERVIENALEADPPV